MRANAVIAVVSALLGGAAHASAVITMQTTAMTLEVIDITPSDGIAASAANPTGTYTALYNDIRYGPTGATDRIGQNCEDCELPSTVVTTHAYGSLQTSASSWAGTSQEVVITPLFSSAGHQTNWIYSFASSMAVFDLAPGTQAIFRTTLSYHAELDFADAPAGNIIKSTVSYAPGCFQNWFASYQCSDFLMEWTGSGTFDGQHELTFTFTNDTDIFVQAVLSPGAEVGAEIAYSGSVPEVPEPASYAMLGTGLAALWLRKRRKTAQD